MKNIVDKNIEKIINFVNTESEIDYLILNGSRANNNIIPDIYSDYDIIAGTKNPDKYLYDQNWANFFGEPLIIQKNLIKKYELTWPIFLIQYKTDNRIDIQFYPGDPKEIYQNDSLSIILLDKNNVLKNKFDPSDKDYLEKKPEKERYIKNINNFYWCSLNVAKGIKRNELTYSIFMYESIIRTNFLNILSWYCVIKNNWEIKTGSLESF